MKNDFCRKPLVPLYIESLRTADCWNRVVWNGKKGTIVCPLPPRSRMHTAYTPTLSSRPRSSLSCALRFLYHSMSPPSSLTHTHRIHSHTLVTSTLLTFMWTQVLWCLARVDRSRVSGVTMDPDIRLTILSTRAQPSVSETFRFLRFRD